MNLFMESRGERSLKFLSEENFIMTDNRGRDEWIQHISGCNGTISATMYVLTWKPALIGQTKVLQSLESISVRTNIRTRLRCQRGITPSTLLVASMLHPSPPMRR